MGIPETRSVRAGRLIRQPAGYRAFIPAPLPPDPPVDLSESLHARLSEADHALARLDGAVSILPDPDRFVYMYIRKEAMHSSRIEGLQSSLQGMLAAELGLPDPEASADVGEVLNCVQAMDHGLKRLADLPVSVRLIRETHAVLMEGLHGGRVPPGELRTRQNWIGPPGCTLANATFVPPPPDEVPRALGDLERFLRAEDPLPPLVRIGLGHPQFESIHPFPDGNGRVGRLLITLLLIEKGLLTLPVLHLSSFFNRRRAEYYYRLQSVQEGGDWEGWLDFFLRGVAEVSRAAARTAAAVLQMREDYRLLITDRLGRAAGNGHRIMARLFEHPIIEVATVSDWLGVTASSSNQLVGRLEGIGLLREITGYARNRLFRFEPYLRLFEEEVGVEA